jgi:hypothetical protein
VLSTLEPDDPEPEELQRAKSAKRNESNEKFLTKEADKSCTSRAPASWCVCTSVCISDNVVCACERRSNTVIS